MKGWDWELLIISGMGIGGLCFLAFIMYLMGRC